MEARDTDLQISSFPALCSTVIRIEKQTCKMDIALDHQDGRLDTAGNCYDLTWADGGGATLRAVIIGPLHGPRYSIDCSEE